MPILLSHVRGLRLENIMVDVLHAIDLGVAAHTIGNILFEFGAVRKSFGGTTMSEGVQLLARHMNAWYNSNRIDSRLRGQLTLERVRQQGDWPKLRGKAAPIRKLSAYALEIVIEFANESERDRLICGVIRCLCRFYEIIDTNSQFLNETSRSELASVGRKFGQLYNALAIESFSQGRRTWKLSPKMHL
eukprot:2875115-Pyramimonas_sp.AAC.1